ncbi:lytic murein transglycosylase [Rheinheimera sp.]|uniref:lytic murein transglycosylase n=1 Tax=Rheinheimera sp. TaxID=1869214 RepID=UPI00307EFB4E
MKLSWYLPVLLSAGLLACSQSAANGTVVTKNAATSVPAATAPDNKPSFAQYAASLKKEAVERGYSPELVKQVFDSLQHYKSAVVADKKQPEFVETLDTYLPKRVSKQRIALARKFYKEHQAELAAIGRKYEVQPRFIMALWALESSFGKIMGNYAVPSALATLAYDGRREAFFRKEFFLALDILAAGHVKLADMKGSWAGAMGQSQFMPSAFMAYAQDGDGDGHINIWQSRLDAWASMANYLKTEGWDQSLTWGRQVTVPKQFDFSLVIPKGSKDRAQWLEWWSKSERSLTDWQALGVRTATGGDLPKRDIRAAMVMPDDEHGRVYLAYSNYQTLMHWNRSYYFVTSVGYLADLIISEG